MVKRLIRCRWWSALLAAPLLAIALSGCNDGPTIEQQHADARTAYRAGDVQDALAKWRVLWNRDHEDARAAYGMGICYQAMAQDAITVRNQPALALRHLDEAEYWLSLAVKADPGHPYAAEARETTRRRKGKLEAAVYAKERFAMDAWPQAMRFIRVGREYEQQGEVDEAERAYRQASAVAPNDPRGPQALAAFYRRIGQDALAQEAEGEANDRIAAQTAIAP